MNLVIVICFIYTSIKEKVEEERLQKELDNRA